MLIRLEIENFYSIRHSQVLDFKVAATAPKSSRFATIFPKEKLRVPKVLAFFGANASGKTTALRAISFLREFVAESFEDYGPGDKIRVYPFDSESDAARPTKLAMEFAPYRQKGEASLIYRYEVTISRDREKNFVSFEALHVRPSGKSFMPIFERELVDGKTVVRDSAFLTLQENDPRRDVRRNVSLLSSLVQFGHEEADRYYDMIKYTIITNVRLGKTKYSEESVTKYLDTHDFALEHLNKTLRVIDVGIESVELMDFEGTKYPIFRHTGLDGVQTLDFESQGTQNFFCLFPNLTFSLNTGAVAVFDEIDSDLHPSLLFEIVRWYLDTKENAEGAQLIMSCQHTSLLSILNKEEVFLVEKGDNGESKVNALAAMESLRRDANLYKKYMAGEFGALPRFG